MKRQILAIFLFLAPSTGFAAEPLSVVYFDSYTPLSWADNGNEHGILIDIVKEAVGKRLDRPIQFNGYPWARAQLQVKEGRADAFITVPTKERLSYTQCSKQPALTATVGIYTYAEHPRMDDLLKIKSYDDLKDFTLVEYLGNGWAKNKFAKLDVSWTNTIEQTYKILSAKRADLLVRNVFNFDYFSRKLYIEDKIIKLPAILSSVPFHLCIAKGSAHVGILDDFDRVIDQMKVDGGLDAIFKRYK